MTGRTRVATAMAFRDQRRRPLVGILLVIVPAYVILWSVALTKPTPRTIGLPGGMLVATTMKALHGPGMAGMMVEFVAALVGVFVMQSALQGDQRLIVAGFRSREVVFPRLIVLGSATLLAAVVSASVMAIDFTPASWLPVIAALALAGLIYAAIGALAGALLDQLPATYLILFLVMTDSIVQSPMFHTTPGRLAFLFPGYAPDRVLYAGSFSPTFHAGGELVLAVAWLAGLTIAVFVVLRRAVGAKA